MIILLAAVLAQIATAQLVDLTVDNFSFAYDLHT